MKNILKKLLAPTICVALALILMTAGVLAADGSASQGQRPEKQRTPGTQQQGASGGGKNRQNKTDDASLAQIKETIEALEDEDKQADLLKLLEAYENALTAEKAATQATASAAQDTRSLRKTAADARSALALALSEAGIDMLNHDANIDSQSNGRPKGDGNRKGRNGLAFGTLDTEAIEKLIAGLDSSDAQHNLTALLKTYTNALEAEKAGINDSSLTDNAKQAQREALTEAADALTEALENAGVEQSDYTRRPGNAGGGSVPSAQLAEGLAESSTAKTGIFQRIADWFGSWFK